MINQNIGSLVCQTSISNEKKDFIHLVKLLQTNSMTYSKIKKNTMQIKIKIDKSLKKRILKEISHQTGEE